MRSSHAFIIIDVLDDQIGNVDARGFGDGFHEGIVSLMILKENHYRFLHGVLGRQKNTKSLDRY